MQPISLFPPRGGTKWWVFISLKEDNKELEVLSPWNAWRIKIKIALMLLNCEHSKKKKIDRTRFALKNFFIEIANQNF